MQRQLHKDAARFLDECSYNARQGNGVRAWHYEIRFLSFITGGDWRAMKRGAESIDTAVRYLQAEDYPLYDALQSALRGGDWRKAIEIYENLRGGDANAG